MNILYINTYYNGGGAEKVTRQLYGSIKGSAINTFCMVGRYQNNVPEDVHIIYRNLVERVITTLFGGILNNTILWTKKARNEIIRYIKQNNIDVVHFHNIHGNYMGIWDIKKISKYCPNIVITLHDMWLITGGCAHSFECEKWKKEKCHNCQGNISIKPFGLAHFLQEQKKKALTGYNISFVTPSIWLQNCCKKSFLKNEMISTIYNGINLDDYMVKDKSKMREKYNLPTNKQILLFVANGMGNVFKGFSYLEKALLLLNNKENYSLIIIGNKKNVDMNVGVEVHSLGYISSQDDLNGIYSAADLFVLPSVADTLPFTAMEAMASGTPVVAFNIGGIPEIVSKDTGWIVETKSPEALAGTIERIFEVDNRNIYEEKCNKCRKRIDEFFNEKDMIKNYLMLYKKIIK